MGDAGVSAAIPKSIGRYRDFINAISFAADNILNAYSNRYATSGRIAAATGELAQMLDAYTGGQFSQAVSQAPAR